MEEGKTKTNKNRLYEEIEIPEGIIASIEDDILIIKKEDKELKRKLISLLDIKVEGNKVLLSAKRPRKIERKLFGTFKAHINNMIKGLTEGFTYNLTIANVHFPMNVSFDKGNNEIVVKNFLGEKKDRRIKLLEGVDVKVDKDTIEIKSYDIEKAGDSATRIEKGTKVRNKDRRIYQDGIFITEKPGRVYL
ncbi:MAG: 50S ribosomal protein L6 [archaeon]